MIRYFSEPVVFAAPRNSPLHKAGSELSDSRRFLSGFFRWASDEPGRRLRNPLPSPMARLTFWTVNRMRLGNYEARHVPLSLHLRASWFTLLYWQQLLEEHKPELWAPAIIQLDLREHVTV